MTHLVLPGIKASSAQDDAPQSSTAPGSVKLCPQIGFPCLHFVTENTKFTFSLGAPQSYCNSVVGLM